MTAITNIQPKRILSDAWSLLRASPVFAAYVLVSLGYVGFIGLMVAQMTLRVDFWLPGGFSQMTHGAAGPHRVHDLTFALLVTTGVIGILAQLRRPSRNVAGMVMAVIPFAALALAGVLADQFETVVRRNPSRSIGAIVAVVVLLHPAGRDFFRSFRMGRINWLMLSLVAVTAVPSLGFASTNIRLQQNVLDEHGFQGHYGFMAAFAFTVIGIGLLASMRPDGWRLTAWVAGVLPALAGGTSLVYPDASSSLNAGWALAAIAWGATFVVVAELTKNAQLPTLRSPRNLPQSTPS